MPRQVPGGLSLAKIGNASAMKLRSRLGVDTRRFRFGDEKEAAGAAVAVMEMGIMEIEWRLMIG
jgi:hypothetical protein